MAAAEILHQDAPTGGAMRGDGLRVAPPQPHLVAGQREIARRRERTVAAAEDGDPHRSS